MMRAVRASISAACSGVKYSNFGAVADCAEECACCAAARTAGQFVATQATERPVALLRRNVRREKSSCTRDPLNCGAFNSKFSGTNGQVSVLVNMLNLWMETDYERAFFVR